ncbi:MAG: UPF0149 family protein [Cellvibrionaceae bacterium]|nr:UPF0149 family protein [Cellvibrionaceae bacterium]
MQSKYSFEFINDQLLNFGAVHSASELHGLLIGLVSTAGAPEIIEWSEIARKFLDLEDSELSEDQHTLFQDLLVVNSDKFSEQLFRFLPLLPAEDSPLRHRTAELGAWCSGFLHGVGRALGGSGEANLDPEVAEALRDIANISQVAVDDNDNPEDNEGYWRELVEYVKVAVLRIHNDYKDKPNDLIVH